MSGILPYTSSGLPGVGGAIKRRAEDFFVQEIPLYEPSGEGEHVYCEVQKLGLTTFDAINRLARALNVSSRDIGYAGLKDANAITRQVFSIPLATPEQVMNAQLPDLTVQWAARHGNKLRLGHLAHDIDSGGRLPPSADECCLSGGATADGGVPARAPKPVPSETDSKPSPAVGTDASLSDVASDSSSLDAGNAHVDEGSQDRGVREADGGGCSCGVAGTRHSWWATLIAGLGLLVRRRRSSGK
jgi:MYXO-CTERM domain-containing protein